MRRDPHAKDGFTLIELLLVLAIISILASIILVALNPGKQLGKSRDAERQSAVNTILNAVYQYAVDRNNIPPGIPIDTPRSICKDNAISCNNGVNLSVLSQSGKYLVAIPSDPQAPLGGTGTNYSIVQSANGRITVSAPGAEQTASISATR